MQIYINDSTTQFILEERKDRKMNSTLPELNKFLKEQALPIDVDSGKIIEHLRNYINASGDGTAAYCSTIIKDEGFFNLIVLPDDFQLYATHEMLHAVSENFTFDFDRALDEVITEFFATKIDDTKIQKEHSKLDIIYSAAIPLVEKFFNDNLERIKSFYISGSHVLFKIYIGYQNYEALCNALTELLNLSKNVLHSYHRTKQVLKDPSLYKNDKYVKAVYKVQQIIQDIENYIAEKNHQNFPIEI